MANALLCDAAFAVVAWGGFCVSASSPHYGPLLRDALRASVTATTLCAVVVVRGRRVQRAAAVALLVIAAVIAADALQRGGWFW